MRVRSWPNSDVPFAHFERLGFLARATRTAPKAKNQASANSRKTVALAGYAELASSKPTKPATPSKVTKKRMNPSDAGNGALRRILCLKRSALIWRKANVPQKAVMKKIPVATAITAVAVQPRAVARGGSVSRPMARGLLTINIMATISGAARTPFTTAAQ